MRRLLLVAILITLGGSLSAQVVSRLGRFSVDKIQGCAPFTVTILDAGLSPSGADCTAGTPCVMFYQGGNACAPGSATCQNQFTYTYNTPGTFTLTVVYQNIGADDIVITVDQNTQPNFEIYSCSNNDVTIKVVDNKYEQYVIDFADGTSEVAIPFGNNMVVPHDYTAAGIYNIKVRGRDSNPDAADNCTPPKAEAFTTINTLPGVNLTSLTATSPTSVQLQATTRPHILYRLEIAVNNGAVFQVVQNIYQPAPAPIDVSNLLLDNNYYCFRLSSFDPCTNTNNYSNTICSQDFDVAFNNGVNNLTWRTGVVGMTGFSWLRTDMTDPQTFSHGEPGVQLNDSDVDYDCNHQYCYQLTISYGSATSTSLQKCGTGQLVITHPAVDNVTGTINGAAAELTWTLDPLLKLQGSEIMRSSNGGSFSLLNTTAGSVATFTDGSYTTEGAYCYQINYVDLCQNYSAAGVIVCPIRLMGSMAANNTVTLNWTPYKGWKDGVASYTVEKVTASGGPITTFPATQDTFLIDDQPDLAHQIVAYRVRANHPVTAATTALSNTLTFTKSVNLTFPTAFTPNADALNDVFHVTGQYVAKMNIRIFDRWGILVFASDNNEPWNGTREGLVLPESAYVWKAEVTDMAGQTFSREGTVVLIRN